MSDVPATPASLIRGVALLAAALVFGVIDFWWLRIEAELRDADVVVFTAGSPAFPIVVPAAPVPEEKRAAELLQATLAAAAGRAARDFPIYSEREHGARRAIHVGATARAQALRWPEKGRSKWEMRVAATAGGGGVFVRAERREAAEVAVAWFLQERLGAQWFMPGPLGEHVPRRAGFVLAAGEEVAEPGFISRDLQVDAEGRTGAWSLRNRLEMRFDHGHNLVNIFRPEDFRRQPEMAPLRNGARYIPTSPADYGWQPDFNSSAAVQHAAVAAQRAFDADPRRRWFSLSLNDSGRFDDSPDTLTAILPRRYFRGRPDFSDLVFRFNNRVAEIVGATHPDRYLTAYAYAWAENTPRFPVARNVMPFVTTDRSQWFDPAFAAADRELVERWVSSGAEIVGAYDYYEGAPYLVPRPMLQGLTEGIPFLHRAGVKAFFAEGAANWALDGPKGWLAAQLLWAPQRNPDELLDIYYRDFWAEAAAPMREFFAAAEEAWRTQPLPGVWLKYYQDEHQALLFPPARRATMRAALEQARRLATAASTRARVEFVAAGFAVTERFAEFCEARAALGRLTQTAADPAAVLSAWRGYREARTALQARFAQVQREHPLALAVTPRIMANYLRSEPDGRAVRALAGSAAGRALLTDAPLTDAFGPGTAPAEVERLLAGAIETLSDPAWRRAEVVWPAGLPYVRDWTRASDVWRGDGEEWEGRKVQLADDANGRRVLRFESCRTETMGQWVGAKGGALYVAQVDARARLSPNNATFLNVTFLDAAQRPLGTGQIDRVPLGDGVQETQLTVIVRAPPEARYVGVGVRVFNQAPGDFAEFSGISLKRAP